MFSSINFGDIDSLNNDALIITLWMDEYKIRRVLVDPRSGVEVMYIFTILRIGIPAKRLMLIKLAIIRVDGLEQLTIGCLDLSVSTPPYHIHTFMWRMHHPRTM